MKITRQQLKKIINESIEEDEEKRRNILGSGFYQNNEALGEDEATVDDLSIEKIEILIKTMNSSDIKQAAALCDALGIDFKQTATFVVKSLIDSKWKIADQIESDVAEHIQKIVKNNLGFYLHNDESNVFYLEDENKAADFSMEFYYGVTGSIINYIERYLIDMVVAIGNE